MTRALRAELIKLSTTRTFLALTGAALGLALLIVVLVTSINDHFTDQDLRDVFSVSHISSLFILLLGAIGMAGEWRHRTIASTVLAVPQRVRLLLAKVVAYAVGGALLALIVNLVVMAIGTLILAARGLNTPNVGDLLDVIWRSLVIAALLGTFGVCVGALIRNTAAAIVLLLALSFVLEPLLFGLAPGVGKFGPLQILPQAITGGNDDPEDLLSAGAAVLAMFAWLGVLFAAAAATFTRRDLV
jgi:ABC-type transport system involved in multi-copper enzyme maturation permease subunit